jgi:hypothetical protein
MKPASHVSRREAIKGIGLGLVMAAAATPGARSSGSPQPRGTPAMSKPPNVLFIISDQHNAYDLAADPWEMKNLFFDPASAAKVAELRTNLLDWLRNYLRTAFTCGTAALGCAFRPIRTPEGGRATVLR